MKKDIVKLLEVIDTLMDYELEHEEEYDPYYINCIGFASRDIKKMVRFIGKARQHCEDETAVTTTENVREEFIMKLQEMLNEMCEKIDAMKTPLDKETVNMISQAEEIDSVIRFLKKMSF